MCAQTACRTLYRRQQVWKISSLGFHEKFRYVVRIWENGEIFPKCFPILASHVFLMGETDNRGRGIPIMSIHRRIHQEGRSFGWNTSVGWRLGEVVLDWFTNFDVVLDWFCLLGLGLLASDRSIRLETIILVAIDRIKPSLTTFWGRPSSFCEIPCYSRSRIFAFFAGVSFHPFFTALLVPIWFVLGWFSKRHLGPLRPASKRRYWGNMVLSCQRWWNLS